MSERHMIELADRLAAIREQDEADELHLDRLHDPASADGWEQSIILALCPPGLAPRNGRAVERPPLFDDVDDAEEVTP